MLTDWLARRAPRSRRRPSRDRHDPPPSDPLKQDIWLLPEVLPPPPNDKPRPKVMPQAEVFRAPFQHRPHALIDEWIVESPLYPRPVSDRTNGNTTTGRSNDINQPTPGFGAAYLNYTTVAFDPLFGPGRKCQPHGYPSPWSSGRAMGILLFVPRLEQALPARQPAQSPPLVRRPSAGIRPLSGANYTSPTLSCPATSPSHVPHAPIPFYPGQCQTPPGDTV